MRLAAMLGCRSVGDGKPTIGGGAPKCGGSSVRGEPSSHSGRCERSARRRVGGGRRRDWPRQQAEEGAEEELLAMSRG